MTDTFDPARVEAVAKVAWEKVTFRAWNAIDRISQEGEMKYVRAILEADAKWLAEQERVRNEKFAGTYNAGEIT